MNIASIFVGRAVQLLFRLRSGSFIIMIALAAVGAYAVLDTSAYESGITGQTQKSTSAGCYCHCSSPGSGTTASLTCSSGTSPLTTAPNTTYNFTMTVSNSSEDAGGCDIATYSGNGLSAGTGLYASSGELTHSSPKAFSGGSTSWSFTYTTGSNAGWDTIYANGNAVNDDGSDDFGTCEDNWNWAPKFIIHIVPPPMRMALSRTSISIGQVRVGASKADSLMVTSNGTAAITINSSAMKSGTLFSSFPTTTDRSLNPGSSEIDSAIFSPTARGSFTDSLIFNTNSDTVPEQRMGAYVSGQGIQAIFNSTYGTSLAFGNLRVGRTAQQTFSFSNSGDDTLFLQTPSISGTGFSIVSVSGLTFPPNQSGSVVVQFAPTATQAYTGTLSFTASDGVSAPTVSLSGTGIAPQIQVSSPVSFGSIRVGQTLQGTATFRNIGTDTLNISYATLTQPSSRFTLGTYSQTVLPNGTGTVSISYQPDQEETDSATLRLSTDDPTDTASSMVVFGSGILPHIQVSDAAFLGAVRVGQTLQGTVSFSNTGKDTLHISNASLAQPSNLFTLGSYDQAVLPNANGTIHIAYTPANEITDSASLYFSTDDPDDSSVTIELTGTGTLPHMALPDSHDTVNFGQIKINTTATQEIAINNNGGADLNILGATASPAPFSIASKPNIVSAGSTGYVNVSFVPTATGAFTGMLIVTGDDNSNPTDTVFLSGMGINSALSIDPASIDFGAVPVNSSVLDTIILTNTGSASVTIIDYKLTSTTNAFTLVDSSAKQIAAGANANIIVSFQPDSAIAYSGTVTLTTDDPETPVRTINLDGHGATESVFINPSPIDFGNVEIGLYPSIRASVKNAGQIAVTLNSVKLSGSSEFSVPTIAAPVTIQVGDSITFDVTFTPTVAGDETGSISFTLADAAPISVSLEGVGVSSGVNSGNSTASQFSMILMPNPANEAVEAQLTILNESESKLSIFDEAGNEVLSMPLGNLSEGEHRITIPTAGLASGSYFVRVLSADGASVVARLIK